MELENEGKEKTGSRNVDRNKFSAAMINDYEDKPGIWNGDGLSHQPITLMKRMNH